MFARQVRLARRVAEWIEVEEGLELLPASEERGKKTFESVHIIVLFRAKNKKVNEILTEMINSSKTIFVSGTSWDGAPAVRIAVSTWKVDVERDVKIITDVLKQVVAN